MFKLINFKKIFPFFILALAVIISYYAISEVNTILNFIGGIFSRIWGIITPFFYGFIVAYILHIPFEALQRLFTDSRFGFVRKHKKAISLILVLIILLWFIFAISALIVPAIYNSIETFVGELPRHWQSAQSWLNNLSNVAIFNMILDAVGVSEQDFNISLGDIMPMLEEWLQDFNFDYVSSALFGVGSALVGIGTGIFTGFLAFISSIYFLIEKDKIKLFLCRLLVIFTPIKVHEFVIKYGGQFDHNCKQYIKIQTVDGLILGTLATIALFFMAPEFALVLGIMLGIVNYIPYFGSIFGTFVAVVIVAFTQGIPMGLISLAVLLFIQQCDANIIQPRLMGGSFKLSPLLVIISITIGGSFAGIFGMIIAIPIVKVLADMLGEIIEYYEECKSARASKAEDNKKDWIG